MVQTCASVTSRTKQDDRQKWRAHDNRKSVWTWLAGWLIRAVWTRKTSRHLLLHHELDKLVVWELPLVHVVFKYRMGNSR